MRDAIEFYCDAFGCTDITQGRARHSFLNDHGIHASLLILGDVYHLCESQFDALNNNRIISRKLSSAKDVKEIFDKLKVDGVVLNEPSLASNTKIFAWVRDKYGNEWQIFN